MRRNGLARRLGSAWACVAAPGVIRAFEMQTLNTGNGTGSFDSRARHGRVRVRVCVVMAVAMSLVVAGCVTSGGGNSSGGATRPYMGKVHVIPGTIELEDFDEGEEG